ncbi:MAG TPA: helix-turn-helix transcriptional regulator, partial [Candidatus Cybelea sp.]|nr:helix-turn-helix transcriptional regulator [Candidatus Cybelea sp.]
GPYARWCFTKGDHDKAVRVLGSALEAVAGPFGATETLVAATELGDLGARRLARSFLSKLDEMAQLPIYAAAAGEMRAIEARRSSDTDAAARHAAAAASAYRSLAWPMHELRVREIGAEGLDGSPGACSGLRIAALSAREREIAAFVAQGISNRGLAERLAVSQRTVEKHITSIFTKLGLRNRTELTALMTRSHIQTSGGDLR